MLTYRPIEEDCDYWDDARPTIVSLLPPCLSFAMKTGSTMSIDFGFVNDILKAVPDQHRDTLEALATRLSWISRYLPNTLPMPIEFQHLQGLLLDQRLKDKACQVLLENDTVRRELDLPTAMQLFKHGLGIARCPVKLDPDWQ